MQVRGSWTIEDRLSEIYHCYILERLGENRDWARFIIVIYRRDLGRIRTRETGGDRITTGEPEGDRLTIGEIEGDKPSIEEKEGDKTVVGETEWG